MTSVNVEAFKSAQEAFARRDIDTVLSFYEPDVEWHAGMAALLPGETTVYRGHGGLRQLIADLDAAFSEFSLEFGEYRDFGDRFLAIGQIRARGRGSEIETISPVAYIVEGKDGKARTVRAYLDPAEALKVVAADE
jgi:ketosteroid isomerase-like protein